MPQLSIVMPAYNGAAFIAEQIASILAQTMGDFELLFLDDGSTDATAAIVAGLARQDERIVVCPTSGNHGQSHRLAELVGRASAPFVCIADQDDVWHPDKNRLLMAAIGGVPMAFGRSELIDAAGTSMGRTLLDAIGATPDPAMRLRTLFRPMVSGHASIMRREWVNIGSFLGAVPFDMALAQEALFSGGLAYGDGAIVLHRLHGGNQMNGGADRQRMGGALSRSRAIESVSWAAGMRVQLWLSLDQLGRSTALDPALRGTMRRLGAACHGAWFASWRRLGGVDRNAELRGMLHDALDPLAGSVADRDDFARRVDLVTRPGWHPARLRDSWMRYRGGPA